MSQLTMLTQPSSSQVACHLICHQNRNARPRLFYRQNHKETLSNLLSGKIKLTDQGHCSKCTTIAWQVACFPDRSKLNTTPSVLHSSFAELNTCAASGCQPCRYIRRELLRTALDKPSIRAQPENWGAVRWAWTIWGAVEERSLLIDVVGMDGKALIWHVLCNVEHALKPLDENADEKTRKIWERNMASRRSLNDIFISNSNIAKSAGDERVFEQVRLWIRQCRDEHSRCWERDGFQPPPRLIKLGREKGILKAFLVESKTLEDSDSLEYCALSYSWGPDAINEHAKTLNVNIDTRIKSGHDINLLPQTSQDALAVVHRIGFQYTWIDSICIIQDNNADWQAQISLMRTICNHASLTLVASSNSASSHGLLNARSHHAYQIQPFDLRGRKLSSICMDNTLNRIEERPGQRRAWTMQEELLSVKVLYWDDDKLWWRCQHVTACEANTGDRPSPIPGFTEKNYLHVNDADIVDHITYWSRLGRSTPQQIDAFTNNAPWAKPWTYKQWQSMVQNYSERAITKEEDSFPAIEGIVELARQVTKDVCVCGLWLGRMHEELLWYPSPPRDFNGRLCKDEDDDGDGNEKVDNMKKLQPRQSLPSWSWFSYANHKRVGFRSPDFDLQFDCPESTMPCRCQEYKSAFIDVQVVSPSSEPTPGPVPETKLQIQGLVTEISWSRLKKVFSEHWSIFIDEEAYYSHNNILFLACRRHPTWEHKKDRGKTWGNHNFDGLLLVEPCFPEEYRRIGILATEEPSNDIVAYFEDLQERTIVLR